MRMNYDDGTWISYVLERFYIVFLFNRLNYQCLCIYIEYENNTLNMKKASVFLEQI